MSGPSPKEVKAIADTAGVPVDAEVAGRIANSIGPAFEGIAPISGTLPFDDAHAAIWRGGGAAQDLNDLVAGPTPLYLLTAMNIDDAGEIVGFGVDTETGEVHAFRATPVHGH